MSIVYGPVPSRRLGQSLGVDPIPFKTCNYNCVYCQLGRTHPLTNRRQDFYPLAAILAEVRAALAAHPPGAIDYVTDVAQVAASLPAPPIVIGHSAGGFIVQKYLEVHPAPAAVLLASVAPSGLLPIVLTMAVRRPLVFLRALPTLNMRRLVGTPELGREWLFSAEMPADQVARFAGQMQNESFLALMDMALLRLVRRSRIRTPLLVLGAEGDRLTPPRTIEATARAYGAPVQIFPGMAHDMMLEPGWEAVAEQMLAWLGQQPALMPR
jgi:hypothetical protein